MKKQSGFISIIAIVVAVLVVAGIGFIYYRASQKNKPVATQDNSGSKADDNKPAAAVDPYAGWKTYTSSYAKLSFKYPADWSVIAYANFDAPEDAPTADAVQLLGPSGLKVSWVAHLGGLGGACDDQAPLGSDGACPLYKIVDKTTSPAISGAYVISGLMTNNNTVFTPWMVVQGGKYAILTDQRTLGIFAWTNDTQTNSAYFGTGGAVGGLVDSAKGTEAAAKAFFGTSEAQQAKLILQSASY